MKTKDDYLVHLNFEKTIYLADSVSKEKTKKQMKVLFFFTYLYFSSESGKTEDVSAR